MLLSGLAFDRHHLIAADRRWIKSPIVPMPPGWSEREWKAQAESQLQSSMEPSLETAGYRAKRPPPNQLVTKCAATLDAHAEPVAAESVAAESVAL